VTQYQMTPEERWATESAIAHCLEVIERKRKSVELAEELLKGLKFALACGIKPSAIKATKYAQKNDPRLDVFYGSFMGAEFCRAVGWADHNGILPVPNRAVLHDGTEIDAPNDASLWPAFRAWRPAQPTRTVSVGVAKQVKQFLAERAATVAACPESPPPAAPETANE